VIGTEGAIPLPLADQITSAPFVDDAEMADRNVRDLKAKIGQSEGLEGLGTLLAGQSHAAALIHGILGTSQFLSRLILSNPAELWAQLQADPTNYLRQSTERLHAEVSQCRRQDEAMKPLREAKRRLALMTALTDLGGVWDVRRVTNALSDGADHLADHCRRQQVRRPARSP
jgi:glutamate-ammonia-ligase adenylyltransferase